MDVLTRERAKPALPFAGTHALIDFALSSAAHARIDDVWVSVQFQAGSLNSYLAGGRPWDLDRTRGGYRRMVPEEGAGSAYQSGFSQGNADGLYRLRDALLLQAPDVIITMSCDSVMAVDLDDAVRRHVERGAECTVVTATTGVREARTMMVVDTDREGRVSGVVYKPDEAAHGTVATEVFLYDAPVLLGELERLRRSLHDGSAGQDDTGLGDFGDHLLPHLVERGRTWAVPLTGYWKDVGRPQSYLQAHRDLLAGRVDVFDQPGRPVLTHPRSEPPALVQEGAEVSRSMIAQGGRVAGTVRRSVLGPRVEVQAGAVVEDCVVLGDAVIEAGAHVATAILDTGVRIGRDAVVGTLHRYGQVPDDAIVLMGGDSQVGARATVPAGARLEPGTTL